MRKPRVIISINTSWNIVNFRGALIRALTAEGFEIVAAAPLDGYSPRLTDLGCRFVPLAIDNKGTSPIRDCNLLRAYVNLFRREQPDVFLGYTIKPNVYGSMAAHLCGIPVINNVSGLGTAFLQETWLTKLVMRLYRLAFSRSKLVFFQNGEDRALFVERRLVDPRRTALLPGSGIDLSHFCPQQLRRSDDSFRFLLVARLLWDKGIAEFVEAARIVRAQAPRARFDMLGFLDVENRTAIGRNVVEQWQSEGVVDYVGATDDVRSYLANADCVVLPSYREGTPRSLLEAAAMGKPLIATDVAGCREVVDDGVNGLLCRVKDAGDLARCMLTMLEMSESRRGLMGNASRAKVERKFDESLVIAAYLDAIRSATGRSGR